MSLFLSSMEDKMTPTSGERHKSGIMSRPPTQGEIRGRSLRSGLETRGRAGRKGKLEMKQNVSGCEELSQRREEGRKKENFDQTDRQTRLKRQRQRQRQAGKRRTTLTNDER